jgi:hypothetical protein
MSLRKSPQLSPDLLAATRQNSTHSTGPRSAAGKDKTKLNALKHGAYAAPENHYAGMLALGEDPEQFEFLKLELMTTYGPGDALWKKQIEDLAKLYWRRQRLERMQTGVMRRALQEVEERQHRRAQEMANATFEPSRREMLEVSLPESTDPGVRARQILSYLALIGAEVRQASGLAPIPLRVKEGQSNGETPPSPPPRSGSALPPVLENLYRGGMGWRVARICRLLHQFCESNETGEQVIPAEAGIHPAGADPRSPACAEDELRGGDGSGEAQGQELLRLLDEEIAAVQEEFQYAEKANQEKVAIERDACLAPAGETWAMMLRQEAALDRSIDRKVRIVMNLRKEYSRLMELAATPPTDDADDAEMQEINEILGLDIPSEIPATEELSENSKMQERSANVYENKEAV